MVTHVIRNSRENGPFDHKILKEKYDETFDPIDHISCFQTTLDLYNAIDAIKCQIFLTTLKGMVRSWFDSFYSYSINSFKQPYKIFVGYF